MLVLTDLTEPLSTAQLIGLQADSTQGANQALIRPL